jgi:hypothetical protein
MAYTETQEYNIEIATNKSLSVRKETVTKKDGVEVGRVFLRTSLMPGEDVSDQPSEVQAVATAVWTPEVVAAYEASAVPLDIPSPAGYEPR